MNHQFSIPLRLKLFDPYRFQPHTSCGIILKVLPHGNIRRRHYLSTSNFLAPFPGRLMFKLKSKHKNGRSTMESIIRPLKPSKDLTSDTSNELKFFLSWLRRTWPRRLRHSYPWVLWLWSRHESLCYQGWVSADKLHEIEGIKDMGNKP